MLFVTGLFYFLKEIALCQSLFLIGMFKSFTVFDMLGFKFAIYLFIYFLLLFLMPKLSFFVHWCQIERVLGEVEKESESEVAQSCPILCDPMDCSLPHSSVHGIFQARVLEWVDISFFRGSS